MFVDIIVEIIFKPLIVVREYFLTFTIWGNYTELRRFCVNRDKLISQYIYQIRSLSPRDLNLFVFFGEKVKNEILTTYLSQ